MIRGPELNLHYHALSDLKLPTVNVDEYVKKKYLGLWLESTYLAPSLMKSGSLFFLNHPDHAELALYALEIGMTHLLCGGILHTKDQPRLYQISQMLEEVPHRASKPTVTHGTPRSLYFGGTNPRTEKIVSYIDQEVDLKALAFVKYGKARIVGGGAEARILDEQAGVYGFTLTGGRAHQEDSLFYSHFVTQSGDTVSYGIVADGVGGNAIGEVASSAFCQGSHAELLKHLRENRLPLIEDVHDAGSLATESQSRFHTSEIDADDERSTPNTVATSFLIVNEEMSIASSGDSPLFLFVFEEETVRIEGYTDAQVSPEKYITNSALQRNPKIYRAKAKAGSIVVAMSDGLAGSLIEHFETHLSSEIRRHFHRNFPHRDLFKIFEQILHVVPAHEFAKVIDHLIHRPSEPLSQSPELSQASQALSGIVLPPPVNDNRTLLVIIVPEANGESESKQWPLAYRPLEKVRDGGDNTAERITSRGMRVVRRQT